MIPFWYVASDVSLDCCSMSFQILKPTNLRLESEGVLSSRPDPKHLREALVLLQLLRDALEKQSEAMMRP